MYNVAFVTMFYISVDRVAMVACRSFSTIKSIKLYNFVTFSLLYNFLQLFAMCPDFLQVQQFCYGHIG